MTKMTGFFGGCAEALSGKGAQRILCDCNGTLINEDQSLNEALFLFLKAAKESGYEVVLVSDHLAMTQMIIEDLMEDRGFSADYLGNVHPKRDYAWHGAFIVFDDHPESQGGVFAEHVMLPDDPRISDMTEKLKLGTGLKPAVLI